MKPEFIYFDLDNTLLDHSSAEKEAQTAIYNSYPELQHVPLEEWLQAYKMLNHRLWLQYQKGDIDRYSLQKTRFKGSMEKLGLDTSNSEEIGTSYMLQYRKYWNWLDGARDALVSISEKYPVGIITNGFSETQQKKIEFMGLKEFSDIFIISEEVGVMKPHQKVFDVATDKAGVDRSEILYVGDSYSSDIIGGKQAGWKTAWYTAFSNAAEQNGKAGADFSFEEFPDLVTYLTV